MINHFITTLYNRVEPNVDGVYVPLTLPLNVPGSPGGFLRSLQGNSQYSSWEFAKAACKVVSASTWQSYLTEFDNRLTTDYDALPGVPGNKMSFLMQIATVPGDVVTALATEMPEIRKGITRNGLLQERAAAVIVGLVNYVTVKNGRAVAGVA